MAESKTAAKKKAEQKYQGVDGWYYLRNPAGAVHSVSKDHARVRLSRAGWDLATDEEIEAYMGAKVQRFDAPIGQPFTPDPDARLAELPGE